MILNIDSQKVVEKDISRIVSRADLSKLDATRIFITGGTGFMGFWILSTINYLIINGLTIMVTVLSRNPAKFLTKFPHFKKSPWLNFQTGDVESYKPLPEKFDFIIHAATDTSPEAAKKPLYLYNSIIHGTERVLEHARKLEVKRVLLISSGAVYGEVSHKIGMIEENLNTGLDFNNINNAYGEGKRVMELLGRLYSNQYRIETVTARCFAFSGFGLNKHFVLNQFLEQAKYKDKIIIKGTGNALRSYLYAADLAVWLLTILLKGESGEAYNVGSDKGYTILQLAELIRNKISPKKEIVILGDKEQSIRKNYIPSIEKAKSLGLDVWTSLEDFIDSWQL